MRKAGVRRPEGDRLHINPSRSYRTTVTGHASNAIVILGQQRAFLRAQEGAKEDSLFKDRFARFLASEVAADKVQDKRLAAEFAAASKYIDDAVLRGTALHHDTRGDFNQVVLLPDAMDTRPFRLPWLEGTVIFLVSSKEAHAKCDALYKAAEVDPEVPRGCLLRRVDADVDGCRFQAELEHAGFRGDRPSVWCLQSLSMPSAFGNGRSDGAVGLTLASIDLTALLAEVANCAGFGSVVCGDVTAASRQTLLNALAANGLLGTALPAEDEVRAAHRWCEEWNVGSAAEICWLFSSQHQRLSLAEMGVYERHVTAAEEADEDFFGNFS